jgi:hypothetical protein
MEAIELFTSRRAAMLEQTFSIASHGWLAALLGFPNLCASTI